VKNKKTGFAILKALPVFVIEFNYIIHMNTTRATITSPPAISKFTMYLDMPDSL